MAYVDADDLVSENWFVRATEQLAGISAGERLVVHPELNWTFDSAHTTSFVPASSDPLFTPYFCYFGNYYESACVASQEAYLDVPYSARDFENGLSYTSWQWMIESIAAGHRHIVAKDTIIFKRRRDRSLTTESDRKRAVVRSLECMAIDEIAKLRRVGPKLAVS
jgi:hypothetical protein